MLFHLTSDETNERATEKHAIHQVMTVALDAATLSNVQAALGNMGCSFYSAHDSTRALQELCTQEFSLVIACYPLPHLLLRHFLQQLRHPTCASRHSPLLVLAIPELLSGASRFIGYGANKVLPRWVSRDQLRSMVQQLLKVPLRYVPSPELEVKIHSPDGSPIPVTRVVNVSENGLLLQSPVTPMLGSTVLTILTHPRLAHSLELPARVVRHAKPGREHVKGFAVTFSPPSTESSFLVNLGLAPRL